MFGRRAERRSIDLQAWARGEIDLSDGGSGDPMRLATVIGCVGLRSALVSQMPINCLQSVNGVRVEVANSLIDQPSLRVVRSVWLQQMMISRDLMGNAIGAITSRDRLGRATTVDWLNPAKVTFDESVPGRLGVKVNGADVDPSDLVIVPDWTPPGSVVGVSRLAKSGMVELALKAQQFASDWFENGATPSAFITSDQHLTSEQARQVRDSVTASWKRRRPAVLGAGLRVELARINGDETQMLQTITAMDSAICRVFGIPSEMQGIAASGQSVTYANRDQRLTDLLVTGLNADLVVIQETLTEHVPRGQVVRFNTGALLRSDLTTRYASYAIALDRGFLTIDEVREMEDRPPLHQGAPA